MKRIIIIAIMLLSVTVASAQEGKNIYNKYSGNKGVSAVYISPAMFRIMGKLPDLEMETADGGTMNLAPLVSSFHGLYILDLSNTTAISTFNKDISSMIDKGRYELLMEIMDEDETIRIYTAGNEKIIESFVFIATEDDGLKFICIDGEINRSDIERLLVNAAE